VVASSEVHDGDVPEVIIAERTRRTGMPLFFACAADARFTAYEHNLGHDRSIPPCRTGWRKSPKGAGENHRKSMLPS
jgi:hypothetical protein